MLIPLVAVSAIVPSLLLLWYFHSRDVHPEPPRVVWATFGLGVLTIPAVVILVLPFMWISKIGEIPNPFLRGFLEAFLSAGIPEEFFKLVVLALYAARHKEFDEPMDGIVYGVAASLGFATLENILYSIEGGLGLAIMRAITAVPMHAFCGAVMGYFVGQAKFGKELAKEGRAFSWGAALVVPAIIHGLYDFPLLTLKAMVERAGGELSESEALMALPLVGLMLVILIGAGVLAFLLSRKLRRAQEAEGPILLPPSPQQAQAAPSPGPFPVGAGSIGPAPRPYAGPLAGASGGAYAPPQGPPQTWTPQQASPPFASPYGPPAAPYRPPLAQPPAPQGSLLQTLLAWSAIAFGGLLASGGGVMSLGVGLALVMGRVEADEVAPMVCGGAIIGLLPLVLGGVIFMLGVRGLNRRDRATHTVTLPS